MLKFKSEKTTHVFTWDKDGPEECWFECNEISPRDYARLTDKNTIYEWDAPPGLSKKARKMAMTRYSKMNSEGFMDDKVDFVIKDWDMRGDDESKVPCTRENKILLDKERPDITNWIYEQLDALVEADEEITEEDEGK